MTTKINWNKKEKEFENKIIKLNNIIYTDFLMSDNDMKKWYNNIDQDYLEDTFLFKKLGDVRKHIKTIEDLKKVKKYLDDDSYYYVYDYIVENE